MTINVESSKLTMRSTSKVFESFRVSLNGEELEKVVEFTYLGSTIFLSWGCDGRGAKVKAKGKEKIPLKMELEEH